MRTSCLTFLLFAAPNVAWAQETPSTLQGKWTGEMAGSRGGELSVELKIGPKTSTWRLASSRATKYDTCINKTFPAEINVGADETIVVSVKGEGVIMGCERSAEFKNTAPGVLEGKVDAKRDLRLTRE